MIGDAHNSPGKGIKLDARTEALLRLLASRERIQRSMEPGHEGPVWHWLEHPFRFLRRWWRRIAPAVMASRAAMATGFGESAASAAHAPGSPDVESLSEAGQAALHSARGWVREHPVASVSMAAVLGALLIGKRGVLWGLALGVGQGLMRQGQGWVMRRLTDPAIYLAIIAALAARPAAEPVRPQPASPSPVPEDQQDQAA